MSTILIVMLLAGCSQKPVQPVREQANAAPEQNTEAESNLFDARKAKEGDLVTGLKIY